MKILKFLIGWPISVVSLIFIAKLILPQSQTLLSSIKNINIILVLVSVLCFLAYFLLRGYLWSKILEEKGYKIPFKKLLFAWNISELKRYTPGNIWSLLGRAISFSDLGVSKKDIISALILEGELVVAGTSLASLFALPFIFNVLPPFPNENIVQPLIYTTAAILSLIFIFNPLKFPLLPRFSNFANFKLLLISFFTFFFFGLGSYFASASIVTLDLKNVLQFVGYFCFALLVGYLSIVTPMGLGVREGVITLGFSKFLSLELAGFVALFSRIMFIASEVIFIFICLFWLKTKNKFIALLEKLINTNKHEALLVVFVLLYFVYMTSASFLRFDNFYTGKFDLGNMDQTVWNTTQGRIFEFTNPNGTNIISRLAFHADFILVLVSPLYFIWSNPKMLLLLQTLVVSFGAVFVFLISKQVLKNRNISIALSIAFLLNPSLQFSNLYDFHAVVLATTFLLATFYFLIKKNYLFFTVFLILSCLTKEDVWIIGVLFGFYAFFIEKKKVLGISISVLCLLMFYFVIWHAIPSAAGGQHFALSYFSQFGQGPIEIAKNIILDPGRTLSIILSHDQLIYLNQLFLPLGFLPLYSIHLLFAVPNLLINLLSSSEPMHEIFYQYTATITPFIFISSIFAIKKIRELFPRISFKIITAYLILTSLYGAYAFGPLPGAKKPNTTMFTKSFENKELVNNYISKIPKNLSVSATNNLGAHLSQRRELFVMPNGIERADLIIFLIRDFNNESSKVLESLEKVKNNKGYSQSINKDGFIVFRRENLR